MEIDYGIVKSVRELEKQGHPRDKIEKSLLEMGYTQKQVDEIMGLETGVDQAEMQAKAKKMLIVLVGGFVALVTVMAVYALLFA